MITNLFSVPKLFCGLFSVPNLILLRPRDTYPPHPNFLQVRILAGPERGFLFQVPVPLTHPQIDRFIVNPVTRHSTCPLLLWMPRFASGQCANIRLLFFSLGGSTSLEKVHPCNNPFERKSTAEFSKIICDVEWVWMPSFL